MEDNTNWVATMSVDDLAREIGVTVDKVPGILEGLNRALGRNLVQPTGDGDLVANFGPHRPVFIGEEKPAGRRGNRRG